MTVVFDNNFPTLPDPRAYACSPLPGRYDHLIDTHVQAHLSAMPRVPRNFTARESWFLIEFARRMATAAVLTQSSALIRAGLAALIVEGGEEDVRVNLEAAALLDDACRRIGTDASPLFAEYADMGQSTEISSALRDFHQRPPADRSPGAWGYVAEGNGDLFRYGRHW